MYSGRFGRVADTPATILRICTSIAPGPRVLKGASGRVGSESFAAHQLESGPESNFEPEARWCPAGLYGADVRLRVMQRQEG